MHMMMIDGQLSVEMTVRRLGGPDVYGKGSAWDPGTSWERTFGGRYYPVQVYPGPMLQQFRLNGRQNPYDFVDLVFYSFERAEHSDPWYGGSLQVMDALSRPIGPSVPFTHYGDPCDIPMITHCFDPYAGHFVVALRSMADKPAPWPGHSHNCPGNSGREVRHCESSCKVCSGDQARACYVCLGIETEPAAEQEVQG